MNLAKGSISTNIVITEYEDNLVTMDEVSLLKNVNPCWPQMTLSHLKINDCQFATEHADNAYVLQKPIDHPYADRTRDL